MAAIFRGSQWVGKAPCDMTSELDIAFYQKVFREYEGDETISVERIEKGEVCKKGTSFVSQVGKVTIFGTRGSGKQNRGKFNDITSLFVEMSKSCLGKSCPESPDLQLLL